MATSSTLEWRNGTTPPISGDPVPVDLVEAAWGTPENGSGVLGTPEDSSGQPPVDPEQAAQSPEENKDNENGDVEETREARIARGRKLLEERRAIRREKFNAFKNVIGGVFSSVRAAAGGAYRATVAKATELGTSVQDARAERAVRTEERQEAAKKRRAAAEKRKAERKDVRAERAARVKKRSELRQMYVDQDHTAAANRRAVKRVLRDAEREMKKFNPQRHEEAVAAQAEAEGTLEALRHRFAGIAELMKGDPELDPAVVQGQVVVQCGEALTALGAEMMEAERRLEDATKWLDTHQEEARLMQAAERVTWACRDRLQALKEEAQRRKGARRQMREDAFKDTGLFLGTTWEAVKDGPVGRSMGWLARVALRIHERAKAY